MIRKNQKGFTLVELIIAVAILAIVTLAVCGFIVVGSRSYTSANTDIMLQQEAQLALNQISDVIIDTTDSISYNVGVQGEKLQPVLKDSEYAGEATDKSLVVVNRKDNTSNNDNASYWFYWNKDDEKIFFGEIDGIDATTTDDEIQNRFDSELDSLDPDSAAVLAEHVTNLSIDISQFEENRVVMISMTLENGNRTYSTSNNVTVRNRIALNIVNIDPMERGDVFKLTTKTVTVEPGENGIDLSAVGKVDFDTSVSGLSLEWTITSSHAGGTSVSDGILNVDLGETNPNFFIDIKPIGEKSDKYASKAQKMQVKVKRVTKVANENITAAAGDEVVLSNAAVTGNNLDIPCDGDSYDGSRDRLIDPNSWTITQNPNNIASLVSKDNKNATVQISPTAKSGDVIIVEANSMRADDKGYGPVTGQWTITIEGGSIPGVIPLPSSGFRFGTDNDNKSHMTYNFIMDNSDMTGYNGGYIVCVRIREMGVSTCYDDQVMVYSCSGENVRFAPDIFGLELNRDYQLFMQLLIPVPWSYYKSNGQADNYQGNADSGYTVAEHYIKNVDSSGIYNSDYYESSPVFSGIVSPPAIVINVDNKMIFPNDYNAYLSHRLIDENNNKGGMTRVIDSIYMADYINIDENDALSSGSVKFSIYEEGGNDLNGWKLIAGYDLSQNSGIGTDNYKSETFGGGLFTVNKKESGKPLLIDNFLNRYNTMTAQQLADASGTYYIVPGFWYKNKTIPELGRGNQYYTVYYRSNNGAQDFSWHYYDQPNSRITLKTEAGFNLRLPDENREQRWTFFPVPSDINFPFERKTVGLQTTTWSKFAKYYRASESSAWEYKGDLNNAKVDCEYNSATDTYTIWVYDEKGRNGATYTRNVYGCYRCTSNGSEWNIYGSLGMYEETVTIKTNIVYTRDGSTLNWAAYFPTPSEGDFPFKSVPMSIEGYTLSGYNMNDNFKRSTHVMMAECHKEGDKYILTLKDEEWNTSKHKRTDTIYGKWSCSGSPGDTWQPVSTPLGKQQPVAVWGPYIEFRINSWDYSYKRAEFPLPGQTGFPSFDGKYTETKRLTYYSDEYGENSGSMSFIVEYTKDQNGTVTIELKNERSYDAWDGPRLEVTSYGKFRPDGDNWKRIEDYTVSDVRVWGTKAKFTYNSTEYMVELPLPGMSNFPQFSDNEAETQPSVYDSNENQTWSIYGVSLKYTKSGDNYKVQIMYNGSSLGTWTLASGASAWVKQ